MRNVMEFEGGYKTVITYDPEIEMFRGEFVGLNGGAGFYASVAAAADGVSLNQWIAQAVREAVRG